MRTATRTPATLDEISAGDYVTRPEWSTAYLVTRRVPGGLVLAGEIGEPTVHRRSDSWELFEKTGR